MIDGDKGLTYLLTHAWVGEDVVAANSKCQAFSLREVMA